MNYPKLLCLFLVCTLWDFQVFLLLVRRGSELFGVSAETDSGIRISAFLIYPTITYCAYFWCALLWDFQVFLLLVRRGSELFGVSAQTDSGIRISAFLIYPTRSYCGYFWCAPLWHFQVILHLVRRVIWTLWSLQLRLTVVLGFLYSLYTLPEVIVPISGVHSLRLSGNSTLSQERVWTLWSVSSDWQWG